MKNFLHQFGGSISAEDKKLYEQSSQWRYGKFQNIEETGMEITPFNFPSLVADNFNNKKERNPKKNIPIIPFDEHLWNKNDNIKFVWYGHSVVLIKINGKNILIDPMLGPDASPIAPITTKRYSKNSLDVIDDFPVIDAVCLTHDHYDHLDYQSVKKLKFKVKHWYVALGIKRHFRSWEFDNDVVTELDWWDEFNVEDVKVTFTPSRHFSGRRGYDNGKSLWGGFVFETENEKIYWSCDGGYGKHFKEIADKFSEFDLSFIECGQYHKLWKQIHMIPEESVKVALDTNSKISVPVHWAGFTLALHAWADPIERFIAEANKQKINYLTPKIGEIVSVALHKNENWWEKYS